MGTFHSFMLLPTELRIAIWEFYTPPLRVLQKDDDSGRWQVLPSATTVPPLLHACRESRSIWMRRYHAVHRLSPGIPFVSYDHDVFLISSLTLQRSYFDGFDMSRITNIGWTNNFLRASSSLKRCQQNLPRLRCFSIVVTNKYRQPNRLMWLPMKHTKRTSSPFHIAYIIYKP